MDQAINPNQFQILDKITESKEKVKLSLRQKFQNIKLETIKDSLKANNINVPDDVSSIKELKKVLKEQLDEISYSQVVQIIDEVTNAYNEMLVGLENGSMDALSKFLKKADKILKPMAKIAGKSLASRTALILAPTIASKLVIAGGLVAGNIYKLIKNKKEGKIVTQDVECDKILQELEITRNNGVISDSRFNEEIQAEIRKFLKSKNVEFTDTGYLSLREAIYSLDYENKKELCNLINSKLGRGINIEERLNAKKGGFFASLKEKLQKIVKPAAAGAGAAVVINSIDPALLAGPVNGTVIGKFIKCITESKVLGKIIGVVSGVGSAILERIPYIGEAVKKVLSAENLVIGGLVGSGIGAVGLVAASVFKTVKGIVDKFKYNKEWKKIQEYDATKYKDDNAKELEIMKEKLNEHENTKSEQMLFDFVYEYFVKELNINFDEKPKNMAQLSEALSKLEESDKKRTTKFLDKLIDYNSNNHSDFVNALIKGGKVASTLAIAGLAGLSIYDILKGGEFLPELSDKIFNNVDVNVNNLIPEKDSIDFYNPTNNESDVSMISNNEESDAMLHYQDVNKMTREGNQLDQDFNYVKYHIDDSTRRGQAFLERLNDDTMNTIKEIPTHLKNFVYKLSSRFDKLSGDYELPIPENPFKDLPSGYADHQAISNYINNLSDDELLNLAYYYNRSANVDTGSVAYEAIGEILTQNNNLLRIDRAIEAYNNRAKMIRAANEVMKDTVEILPVISETDEELKKMCN